jgi:hypothetical protein
MRVKYKKGEKVIYKEQEVEILEISEDPAPYRVTYKIEVVTKTSTQRFWVYGTALHTNTIF